MTDRKSPSRPASSAPKIEVVGMRRSAPPSARRHRGPKTWADWVLVGVGVAAAVLVGVAVMVVPGRAAVPPDDATRLAVQQLRHLIEQRDASLLPQQKQECLEAIREDLTDLEPAIVWLLGQPEHKLFGPVAGVAADLELASAIEPLHRAVDVAGGERRGAAVVALDRLEPLSTDRLRDLIESSDAKVVAIGVQLLATRPAVPPELVDGLLRAFGSGDERLAALALGCLPETLGEQHVPTVLQWIDDPRVGARAFELLTRLPRTQEGAEVVLSRLADANEAQFARLLPVIEYYAQSETVRAQLWRIVEDGPVMSLRVAALDCLSRAGDVASIPATVDAWPPVLQFFVARMRVEAGELGGIDALLALSVVDEDAPQEEKEAAGRSRMLLGKIAGLPPHSGPTAFAAWREKLTAVPAPALRDPTATPAR